MMNNPSGNNRPNVKNIRIGEILREYGYISDSQLNQALAAQQVDKSKLLGDILVEMGFVTENQKLEALGQRLSLPLIRLDKYPTNPQAVARIPEALATKYKLIAIDFQQGRLLVAINDPLKFFEIEDVRQQVKMPVEICLAETAQITAAIEYYYSEIHARQAAATAQLTAPSLSDPAPNPDTAEEVPVVKLLNSLLVRGFSTNASDIHIEPFEQQVLIRIRVDGTIVDYLTVATSMHQALIARIKILAALDIAEKRIPQDGHFRIMLSGMDMNLRVSLIPTVYGEKAVLRFLSTNAKIDHDDKFGMTEANYLKINQALQSPHGLVYLTGPTGSGKTTTLYMILSSLTQRQVNISTIEDPVEKNIARVNQIQVNNTAGMSFGVGLRALLRQDPDIIMVGETRDEETAAISVRAAITGHLVLSTLHTNDAVSSILRLVDMGVPAYMVASSLVAVVAQRLVRKVCPECGYTYVPDQAEQQIIGQPVSQLRRGHGCQVCNNTGYKGRVAVHEIVLIDREMRNMISGRATMDQLFDYVVKIQGMSTLRQEATKLVLAGVTTTEELLKTAYYEGV
ncbi:MAG: GspE/PulE family protein [Clostridiales bacterium]